MKFMDKTGIISEVFGYYGNTNNQFAIELISREE